MPMMYEQAIVIAFWGAFSIVLLFGVILTVAGGYALAQRLSHAYQRREALHEHEMHRISIEAARLAVELTGPSDRIDPK